MRVPIGVPGGGVWGRVQVGGGGWFSVENKGKGEGGGEGGGWGGDRQRNGQVDAQALSKLPFSKLPFSFFPILADPNMQNHNVSTAETFHRRALQGGQGQGFHPLGQIDLRNEVEDLLRTPEADSKGCC